MHGLRAAGRYVQGDGALDAAGEHLDVLDADRAVVVGGDTALSVAEESVKAGLATAGIDHAATVSGVDDSTADRIDGLVDGVSDASADLVVGVGGGTAIDAAKAAATRTERAFVSVPTVASTDAPASGLSVVYDDAGRPVDSIPRERPPELVLVDTGAVAAAPARFLRGGLGDALATAYEAEACAESGGSTPHGEAPSDAGLALARRCRAVVAADGADALAAVERGVVTPAVERAVEVATCHSALGFENAGLAGAHTLEIGCRLAGHTAPGHGELVGVCTLAQLEIEAHEDRDSYAGLLVELGFDDPLPPDGSLDAAGEFACIDEGSMANEPVDVEPADAAAGLRAARERLDAAR